MGAKEGLKRTVCVSGLSQVTEDRGKENFRMSKPTVKVEIVL